NANGIATIYTVSDYSEFTMSTYELDSIGKLIGVITYKGHGYPGAEEYTNLSTRDTSIANCEYDSHGNWVTRTWLKKEIKYGQTTQVPYLIERRKFTYFQ